MQRALILAVASFLLLWASADAQRRWDRPVEHLEMSPEGDYRAGHMDWYGRGLFPTFGNRPPELILLGEVIDSGYAEGKVDSGGVRVPGRIRVTQVVRCPARLRGEAEGIETLTSQALIDLREGERIFVWLVPYEGQYAIPVFRKGNCSVGFWLAPWDEDDEERFIALLGDEGAWVVDELSLAELRLWAHIAPLEVALHAVDLLEGRGQDAGDDSQGGNARPAKAAR